MPGVGVFWNSGSAPMGMKDEHLANLLIEKLKEAYQESMIRDFTDQRTVTRLIRIKVAKMPIPNSEQSFVWSATGWQ